jgi:hypothetical protein
LPALCCGGGGALGALWGYCYSIQVDVTPAAGFMAIGAAVGAVLGSYLFALIE